MAHGTTLERKQIRLRKAGGSQSIILPGRWLRRMGVAGEVELVDAGDHLEVYPARPRALALEEQPEFGAFLEFLAKSALAHPEHLGNVAELLDEDTDLVEGVSVEA